MAFSKYRNKKIIYSKYHFAQTIESTINPKQTTHDVHSILNGGKLVETEQKIDLLTKQLNEQRSYLKRKEEIKQQKQKKERISTVEYLSKIPSKAIWSTALSALILLIAALIYFFYSSNKIASIDFSKIAFYSYVSNISSTNSEDSSKYSLTSSATNISANSSVLGSTTQNANTSVTSSKTTAASTSEIALNLFNKNGDDVNIVELTIQDVSNAPFSINVDKVHKLPKDYIPIDLIPTELPGGGLLKIEAVNLLRKLFEDASAHGIKMKIVSAYRSYEDQEGLFNYYVNQEISAGAITESDAVERANKYSAKPGHSEHQLGTTVDINCFECEELSSEANNDIVWKFLETNGPKYGYKVSYPKDNLQGYQYEPWHIRYYGL